MNGRVFIGIILLIAAAGTWNIGRLRTAISDVETRMVGRERSTVPAPSVEKVAQSRAEVDPPSPELLHLRAEVSMLRGELERAQSSPAPRITPKQSADDWALVHSGPKPSEFPGYVSFTNLTRAGFATPDAALQSYYYAMRNQQTEPLTQSRMKELFDVPDDFDDPEAKYSISLGMGMGGETGFRIVNQEFIAPNEVRLTLDLENRDGSSSRQERVMVQKDGRWRLKPVAVRRETR